MPGQLQTTSKSYLKIIDGTFVIPCKEGEVGSRSRQYEDDNKKMQTVYEVPYASWTGTVQNISFKEGKFGEQCFVELEDITIALGTAGRYFKDFACKLLSGDMSKPFTFHPYSMGGENEKKIQGVSVQQNGVKLPIYFYDKNTKTNINGFPNVDEAMQAKLKKNYWKVYFAEVEAFLIEELKKLSIAEKPVKATVTDLDDIPDSDLPF
jgi:hypothetical protein